MSRYRKIQARTRADSKYRALSAPQPNGRTLWEYLLTCGRDYSVPGLIVTGVAQLAEELEWPVEDTRRVWQEIEDLGMAKADWRARVVWVVHALQENPPRNPSVVSGWRTHWIEIPECALKEEAHIAALAVMADKGPAWLEAFTKACPAPKFTGLRPVFPRSASSPDNGGHNGGHNAGDDAPHIREQRTENKEQRTKIPPSPPVGGEREDSPAAPPAEPSTLTAYVDAWNRGAGDSGVSRAHAPSERTIERDKKLRQEIKRFSDPGEWEWCARALASDPHFCGANGWGPASLGWLLERGKGAKLEQWMSKGLGLREGTWRPPKERAQSGTLALGGAPREGPLTSAEANARRVRRMVEEAKAREAAVEPPQGTITIDIDADPAERGEWRIPAQLVERRAYDRGGSA